MSGRVARARAGEASGRGGRIPLPRLVVGILLHVCVPAYLLACLVACFLPSPVASAAEIVPRMLWTGAWFLPAFLLLTGLASGTAALVEARLSPPTPDDAAVSRAQLGAARRQLAALGDRRVDRALARLDALAWEYHDPRDQKLTADLDAAARTFGAAAASASAEKRPEILALATESVDRLLAAGQALAAERSRLDEGDARTVAGYLAARYPE